jgi:hypothetical protein
VNHLAVAATIDRAAGCKLVVANGLPMSDLSS